MLAKVFAKRLKIVMSSIISPNQSAFIEGRQILDSVLISNEDIHDLKARGGGGVLFKVDFEKAFDSVSWRYLEYVMGRMGFPWKWVSWINECIQSSSISFLLNGSPTGEFAFLLLRFSGWSKLQKIEC